MRVELPSNPLVYIVLFVLLGVLAYIMATVLIDVLPAVIAVSTVVAILSLAHDEEEIALFCALVGISAAIVFLLSHAYVDFCESHPLGQVLIDSGEKMIGSAGNTTQT